MDLKVNCWLQASLSGEIRHRSETIVCHCPFAITVVIITHFPAMSTVWSHFFSNLKRKQKPKIQYFSDFLCNLMFTFSLFPSDSQGSPCRCYQSFPKFRKNGLRFCAIGHSEKIHFLHALRGKKIFCFFRQEIINAHLNQRKFCVML